MPSSRSWFFYMCAIEGAAAMAVLLLIPSEGGTLSPARLALIGCIAVLCLLWIVLGLRAPYSLDRFARPVYVYACVLLSLALSLLLFLLRYFNPQELLSVYQRLSPLLWYLLVLSIQFSVFFLFSYCGIHLDVFNAQRSIYFSAFLVFCLLLLVFLFITITGLGLTPDPAYWGEPGVPILGWQFVLAWIGGICVLVFMLAGQKRNERILDRVLPVVIYLLAVTIWLGVPADVLAHSFYMPIDPLTLQPFPYSDAGYYDRMAHSLLIGHPYQGQIPTRPLYILFLAVLHRLFGENYRNIIAGQTIVLAVIPVIFYFLGKKLHSRVAGVIVALFFIFRELTALLVSSDTRVSNTKTLLVDVPTLMLLLLACFFAIRWLEQKNERNALIAGGTFGLLLLLRTQSALVLPVILLLALLTFGWKHKSSYLLVCLFVLGSLITVAPWLTHNYLRTGHFTFDAPLQYASIASQYAYTGNLDIRSVDLEGKGLGRILIEFTLKDPAFVFGFISNHFFAAQVGGLLALPLIKPFNGIFEPINLYWLNWDGRLEWYNLLLVVFYLVLIAFGLDSAWRRWYWIGLLPLGVSVGYALATAVGRFSGWRYDLPADWVWYFYLGIGSAELFLHGACLLGASPRAEQSGAVGNPQTKSAFPQLLLLSCLFAFLGGVPWLAEKITSPRYPDQTREFLVQKIASLSNAPTPDVIKSFVSQPDVFLQTGRVVYPRFFFKNNGLSSSHPSAAYAVRDYPRIGFLLLNQGSSFIVFPTKKISDFPHAADAIVLGCRHEEYVEARVIVFPELASVYSSASLTEPCSP